MTIVVNDSLGDYLRNERESRGISVAVVSRDTRISEELIRALEDNHLESFSQPEFTLGCLKLYSARLGLDQQEVLKRAEEEFIRLRRQNTPKNRRPFLSYNSPLGQTEKKASRMFRRPDRMVKRASLTVFSVLLISLFFFIPSEYKGPDSLHSDVSSRTSLASIRPEPQPAVSASVAEPMPASVNPPSPSAKEEPVKVIGNSDSRRYHLPGMKYYDQVQAYHRVVFDSEQGAIEAGYHKAPR